jgi:phasin
MATEPKETVMSDTNTTSNGTTSGPDTGTRDAPFEAFNIHMPNVEVPAAFRAFADQAITGSQEAYERLKSAAEDASSTLEESYEATRSGLMAMTRTSLDNAKHQTDAAFAFARDVMGATSFAEAVDLQASFARRQFETFSEQARTMQALMQKVSIDASSPVRQSVEKALKDL